MWTAASAVVLVAIMPERLDPRLWFPDDVRQDVEWRDNAWRGASVVLAPILGVGLAAIAMAAWRAAKGRPGFPTAPGHWLLLILGATAVAILYARLVDVIGGAGPPEFWLLTLGLVALFPVVLLFVAAGNVREPRRWRHAYLIAIWSGSFYLIFGCVYSMVREPAIVGLIAMALFLATPLSIVIAAIRDWQLGVHQDTFHWAGVVAVPALAAMVLVLMCLMA